MLWEGERLAMEVKLELLFRVSLLVVLELRVVGVVTAHVSSRQAQHQGTDPNSYELAKYLHP